MILNKKKTKETKKKNGLFTLGISKKKSYSLDSFSDVF